MNIDKIVNLAAHAGKIMLESGAEIYRVEETITRIGNSYSIFSIDAFVTLNVIIVSASNEYGESPLSTVLTIRTLPIPTTTTTTVATTTSTTTTTTTAKPTTTTTTAKPTTTTTTQA